MSKMEGSIPLHLTEIEAEKIRQRLPVEEEIQDLSEFLRVFGDPTRIRILFLLKYGEYCVHDISKLIDMQQTAVSHQLKILRQSRLVKYRKDGKHVFYSLDDQHIEEILSTGLSHINELQSNQRL